MDKTMIQAMKERIGDIARKCAEIRPLPIIGKDAETDESEEK